MILVKQFWGGANAIGELLSEEDYILMTAGGKVCLREWFPNMEEGSGGTI